MILSAVVRSLKVSGLVNKWCNVFTESILMMENKFL